MKDWEAQALVGGGISIVITIGVIWYQKSQAASQAAAAASTAAQSGVAASQTLSLSGQKSFSVTLPSGATFTSSQSLSPSVVTASQMTFTAASQAN